MLLVPRPPPQLHNLLLQQRHHLIGHGGIRPTAGLLLGDGRLGNQGAL